MYDIHYDPDAGVMRVRLTGFWTIDDVGRFAAAWQAAVQAMPEARRDFDLLSDASDFPVQSTEVSAGLGRTMAMAGQTNRTGRKAIIVGTIINKLQAQRELTATNVRIFLSIDEARAWLATPRGAVG